MTRHEVLLQQYARELAGAKTRAEAWWLERSRNIRAEAGSKKSAGDTGPEHDARAAR